MFVAGDIGGTKTTVALYEEADGALKQLRDETFKSKDHTSLEQILGKFLKGEKLKAGCFGVAGAVIEGKAQTTNLPWKLDEKALAVRHRRTGRQAAQRPGGRRLRDAPPEAGGVGVAQSR